MRCVPCSMRAPVLLVRDGETRADASVPECPATCTLSYNSTAAVRQYFRSHLQHAVHPPSVQQQLLGRQVIDAEGLHQLHVGLQGSVWRWHVAQQGT